MRKDSNCGDMANASDESRRRQIARRYIPWILFAAIGACWCLSFIRTDCLRWPANARQSWLISQSFGDVVFGLSFTQVTQARYDGFMSGAERDPVWNYVVDDSPATGKSFLCFTYVEGSGPGVGRPTTWAYVVPYWPLVLLASAIPSVRVITWYAGHRRFLKGRCRQCGYDLRATPERCPECGAVQNVSPQARMKISVR
jgi:hypothetical protein